MDEEMRKLVTEILTLVVLLIIVIPICVNASNRYNEKKEEMLTIANATVDIENGGEYKNVIIYSGSEKTVTASLILKISEFSDDYLIYVDDSVYELSSLEYTTVNDYRYYNIGTYEVEKKTKVKFKIEPKGKVYYDETITYSFCVESFL